MTPEEKRRYFREYARNYYHTQKDRGATEPAGTAVGRMFINGMTYDQIGAVFGVTKATVQRWVGRTPEYAEALAYANDRKDRVLRLAADGWTTNDIADAVGWDRNSVWAFLRRRGVPDNRKVLLIEAAWKDFRDGITLHQLAARYGYSWLTIRTRFIERYGAEYSREAAAHNAANRLTSVKLARAAHARKRAARKRITMVAPPD